MAGLLDCNIKIIASRVFQAIHYHEALPLTRIALKCLYLPLEDSGTNALKNAMALKAVAARSFAGLFNIWF